MARAPFKLRSSGPFKMMGSSPAKQGLKAERRELTKQVDKPKEPSGKLVNTPEGVEGPKLERIGIKRSPEVPRLQRDPENKPKKRIRDFTPVAEEHRRKKDKLEGKTTKQKTKKRPTINVPPHPDLKNIKKRKDTLKGRTGFEYDVVDPVRSKVRQGVRQLKKVYVDNPIHVAKNLYKKTKKIRDYFTKD